MFGIDEFYKKVLDFRLTVRVSWRDDLGDSDFLQCIPTTFPDYFVSNATKPKKLCAMTNDQTT